MAKTYIITANERFEGVETNLFKAIETLKKKHSFGWLENFKSYSQLWRDFKLKGSINIYHNSGIMYKIIVVKK